MGAPPLLLLLLLLLLPPRRVVVLLQRRTVGGRAARCGKLRLSGHAAVVSHAVPPPLSLRRSLQTGMRGAFGKTYGTVARVKIGQILLSVRARDQHNTTMHTHSIAR